MKRFFNHRQIRGVFASVVIILSVFVLFILFTNTGYSFEDTTGYRWTKQDKRVTNLTLLKNLRNYLLEYRQSPDGKIPECKRNVSLGEILHENHTKLNNDPWSQFYSQISSCELYIEGSQIDTLLSVLATALITHTEYFDKGTQVKIKVTFENGHKAVFKPKIFSREQEANKNHFYFTFDERHYAEIAAFHLDRILGFRRAVPTVGRMLTLSAEIKETAEEDLRDAFYLSPAGNLCFLPHDERDTRHAVCGEGQNGELKEVAVQLFLPSSDLAPRKLNWSPYKRSYSKSNHLAVWQKDNMYCEWNVKRRKEYTNDRRLFDLIDLSILDFLIGNQDRHSFDSFSVFNDSIAYPLHLDHGCAFGSSEKDDLDILKPLTQCCIIRPSTLESLLRFYQGPSTLSEELQRSMSKDPVAPILSPKHYPAIERRLVTILHAVERCIINKGHFSLVISTTYVNPEVPDGLDSDELESE